MTMAVIGITACSGDDDSNNEGGGGDVKLERNPVELNAIPISTLENEISIAGATTNEGVPPTPNSDIEFNLDSTKTEAFQGTGFNIVFDSDADIAGAYIQLADADKNPVNSYFDVPVFSNAVPAEDPSVGNKVLRSSFSKRKSLGSKSLDDDDSYEINVDFTDEMPPGRFCFFICIYDSENNISQVIEQCIIVEAWGGLNTIVGQWVFDRSEGDLDNDITLITCENGTSFEAEYSQEISSIWYLNLFDTGSYEEEFKDEEKELDYNASVAECKAIYEDTSTNSNDKFFGNWAYNEDNQTLTLIDFKDINLLTGEENVYPEGELYFEGIKVEVVNGELILNNQEEGVKAIFKKR